MILRSFTPDDTAVLKNRMHPDMTNEALEAIIREWETHSFGGRYFEMLAASADGEIVGMISLYEQSEGVVSIGPEIFTAFRRMGFGREAMRQALDRAKELRYHTVSQQIRTDNAASIALHQSLGFELDGREFINRRGNRCMIWKKSL
ncbi:MAG: GNAT family N-acetyltransferase [Clostridia bacterium]|nr:GNAT family N-acetyltransferase [Clostridia bacterium]MBQ8368925.1 GNAT family N-acetyltransferase [Clostridia bacterium]